MSVQSELLEIEKLIGKFQGNAKRVAKLMYKEFLKGNSLGFSIYDLLTMQVEPDFLSFVSSITLETGRRFSFEDHRYLYQIYKEASEKKVGDKLHWVINKGAQMGLSTFAILFSLYNCRYRFDSGTIYFFPTRSDVFDFSKTRIDPIIERNPDYFDLEGEVNNAGIKNIGKSFLYFRGMKTSMQMKAVPADMLIFDELDEVSLSDRQMAEERISHSPYKWVIELSVPSVPDYGIDKLFQKSDQRHWVIKCVHCNHDVCLEEEFPKTLNQEIPFYKEKNGEIFLVCPKCKKDLDVDNGRWVAKYSNRDYVGWCVSQLYSKYVSPKSIWEAYYDEDKRKYIDVLYNHKIGVAWVSATGRIDKEKILKLCGSYEMLEKSEKPCTMGVDVGDLMHVVVSRWKDDRRQIVWLGTVKDPEQIAKMINDFKVERVVIDALPEIRMVDNLINEFPSKVYKCWYSDNIKLGEKWNFEDHEVTVNRTRSLSNAKELLEAGSVILPSSYYSEVNEFAQHWANLVKKKEEDEKGNVKYVYVHTGPDHFAHAFNYDVIAWNTDTLPEIDIIEITDEEEDEFEGLL